MFWPVLTCLTCLLPRCHRARTSPCWARWTKCTVPPTSTLPQRVTTTSTSVSSTLQALSTMTPLVRHLIIHKHHSPVAVYYDLTGTASNYSQTSQSCAVHIRPSGHWVPGHVPVSVNFQMHWSDGSRYKMCVSVREGAHTRKLKVGAELKKRR